MPYKSLTLIYPGKKKRRLSVMYVSAQLCAHPRVYKNTNAHTLKSFHLLFFLFIYEKKENDHINWTENAKTDEKKSRLKAEKDLCGMKLRVCDRWEKKGRFDRRWRRCWFLFYLWWGPIAMIMAVVVVMFVYFEHDSFHSWAVFVRRSHAAISTCVENTERSC